jgi:hypothetical protein
MIEIIEKYYWSKWEKFPDPRKRDYINAPFGFGIYQLRNVESGEFILFGSGNMCAYRMSSLLPSPYGAGIRNNSEKREYVLSNIKNIEYRTISFESKTEMKKVEDEIKKLEAHKFNT